MSTRTIVRASLVCPRCHSHDVSRSRTRGFLERAARVFGLRPFRCMDCYDRFFSFGSVARRDPQPSEPDGLHPETAPPRGESAKLRRV